VTSRYVYVDETKRAGYVLAAVAVAEPQAARQVVRGLIVPGRRRLHMHNETLRQRRLMVSTFVGMALEATVYDAGRGYRTDREARTACLTALVADLAAMGGGTELVIEQDDSLIRHDNQTLIELTRSTGQRDALHYRHLRGHDEPLLSLPDTVAWCWARSGEWRRRIAPVLVQVRRL
jgi:hypothetical protein